MTSSWKRKALDSLSEIAASDDVAGSLRELRTTVTSQVTSQVATTVSSTVASAVGGSVDQAAGLKERASAIGQTALITLGLVLLQGWIVLPLTVSRIVRARRAGERAAQRFRVGAGIAAAQVALAVPFWVAVAQAESDDPNVAVDAFLYMLAGISALVLVVSGVRLAWAWLRPASSSSKKATKAAVDRGLFDKSDASRAVEDAVTRLASYAPLYAGHRLGTGPDAPATSDRITRVVTLSQELFRRLQAKGTEQQTRLAKTRYADILGKLTMIVGPDYLKDVIDHPELWHHPEQRVSEVAAAIDDVERQLLENIRQTNAAADLDFQVALSTLAQITADDEFTHLYAATVR